MNRQVRSLPCEFQTREDGDEMRIEGYFAVFEPATYEIAPGMSESVAAGAFSNSMGGDIRALINHDTMFVLGRTTAHTFELREDAHGLWGSILINPKDRAAVDAYERVKRGDVSQCSFGFDIVSEDTDIRDDGSVHWTIRDVKLYECSIVTFPAYQETNISARAEQRDDLIKRQKQAWRAQMLNKLKGANDGIKDTDAAQKDRPEE